MTTGEQPVRDEDEYRFLADEAFLINSDIQAARRTFQDLQIQLADLNRRKRDLAVAAFSSSHQPTMDRHADVVKDIKEAHQAQARALERRDGGVEDALKHSQEHSWVYHDMAVEYAQDPNHGITNLQIGKIAVRIRHPDPVEQSNQGVGPIEVTV